MDQVFTHYGFNESHGIASDLAKNEASHKPGTPEHLAAILFVAFTYESALNHLGSLSVQSWEEHFERLSPEAKLVLLAERAGLKPDFNAAPYQSFKLLFKIRNSLAHPKVSKIEVSNEQLKDPKKWPRPKWMIQAEGLSVRDALADLDSVVQELQASLGVNLPPKFLLMELFERNGSRQSRFA
jgi:hypothetical protein